MSKYELGCVAGELSNKLKINDLGTPRARKFLYNVSKIYKVYDGDLSLKQEQFLEILLLKFEFLIRK